ncbi:DNA polymerase III subunit delta [Nocardioides sp. GY 10113]|uniref:DNA polymerase III subunit delta n=1 Tax=Nocardioides sp. GY 10113 TaxID=2569761 RepID=UPI0010A7F299|nr:DNA polymerase III subunit delta [Nocardioides sp. GY 10113]TIC84863.1 DNA polymerase III subunit delta [Nocardioides sp. GY 10113]
MRVAEVLGRVVLITGKEEFLAARTVADVKAAVRGHDPESEFSEAAAAELTLATLGELAAPSLFSSVRCVVVRGLEDLPDESVAGLLDYAAGPAEDVALVLVHGGGAKGSGVLAKLRKAAGVTEIKSAEIKPWEMPEFAVGEAKRLGARLDKAAAQVLTEAVGADLRSLSAAVDQLTNDFPGERIDEEKVRRYFGGRAEVKNYEIADAILAGQRERALGELRWALEAGTSEVYILSAIAAQTRTLANHVGGVRVQGMPAWKAKNLNKQAAGWSPDGIGRALQEIARADADLKGAASDASYTLERLVLTVAALRDHRR